MREFVQQNDQQADATTRVIVETEIPVDARQTVVVIVDRAVEGCRDVVGIGYKVRGGQGIRQRSVIPGVGLRRVGEIADDLDRPR